MTTATLAPPTLETIPTVADLMHDLGDIPPQRILLRPAIGTATEQDVIEFETRTGRLCELVDGTLVEKAMGCYESRLGFVLGYFLEDFAKITGHGFAIGGDALLRLQPGLVRIPDISFFLWNRFPNRILPPGAFLSMTPDLAVEVLSPSNTRREMARKRREYFAGGARLVWEVDPEKRTVTVYTATDVSTVLTEDDTLTAAEVLPGFSLSIKAWFAQAGIRG